MTAVESLPTPTRRHRWGEPKSIARTDTPSQCDETHRACLNGCGITKVTVHPPSPEPPYRMWKYADRERADGLTPMCGEP